MSELKTTPLHATHKKLGARLVEFGGFEMPVQYESILKEHAAVRETAGLFDVSHMGQIEIFGPRAVEAVEKLLSCRVATLGIGRVRYGLMCNREGGVVDDVTLYRRAENAFMLCVNASNIDKDEAWIRANILDGAEVQNDSDHTGMLALQGPNAAKILAAIAGDAPGALPRFAFDEFDCAGAKALISNTGYTGAPGFELYLPADVTVRIFEALMTAGKPHGIAPAGLGARDTLRLEAALPLYGHELDDTTSPLEARLDRFVKRKTGGFIGAEAVEARAQAPDQRQLVGFKMVERGIARPEHPIVKGDTTIGRVTSGAPSPTLGISIGLGYVTPEHAEVGSEIAIEIRGKNVQAQVVDTPFVTKVDQKKSA